MRHCTRPYPSGQEVALAADAEDASIALGPPGGVEWETDVRLTPSPMFFFFNNLEEADTLWVPIREEFRAALVALPEARRRAVESLFRDPSADAEAAEWLVTSVGGTTGESAARLRDAGLAAAFSRIVSRSWLTGFLSQEPEILRSLWPTTDALLGALERATVRPDDTPDQAAARADSWAVGVAALALHDPTVTPLVIPRPRMDDGLRNPDRGTSVAQTRTPSGLPVPPAPTALAPPHHNRRLAGLGTKVRHWLAGR